MSFQLVRAFDRLKSGEAGSPPRAVHFVLPESAMPAEVLRDFHQDAPPFKMGCDKRNKVNELSIKSGGGYALG